METLDEFRDLQDRKKAAERLIIDDPLLSSNEVAKRTDLNCRTVIRLRSKLEDSRKIPHLQIVRGSDGKTYPRKKSRRGLADKNSISCSEAREILDAIAACVPEDKSLEMIFWIGYMMCDKAGFPSYKPIFEQLHNVGKLVDELRQ